MYQPIQNARLYEQVVQQIEERIVNREIEPGDKLPSEIELADQFGVSRTVIREATKALRTKGLIEVQLGRGTFVTGGASQILQSSLAQVLKTNDEICLEDLYELRELLEPGFSALAVERAIEADLEAMQDALDSMEAAIEDVEAYIEADLRFHYALAKATKNPVAVQLITPFLLLPRPQLVQAVKLREGTNYLLPREERIAQHKRILDSILQRDRRAAIDAMQDHLVAVRLRKD